jgi:MFS family permease
VVVGTTATGVARPKGRRIWPRTFLALEDQNFRWFFAALFGNFTAMNMQMFMRGWLVFELTGSFAALGIMSLANGIAGLVPALFGGVIADRVRQKKHVVQIGQGLNAIIVLVVGMLIATDLLRFSHLVVAALCQGAVMNTMMPSRQALTPEILGMERLMNAIALNTMGMNAARLLMPGFAGWLVGALNDGSGISAAQWVYFMMAGLYASSILILIKVSVQDRIAPVGGEVPALRELAAGFRYVWKAPTIRMLLLCHFFMALFSMTYFMLLPGFAKEVLSAGPGRLGLLTSISGVGSLVGSLIIASLPSRRRGLILLLSSLLLGVGLVAFSISTSFWLSVGILAIVGLGQAGRMSLSNVLVQAYVEDEYRGRVMSIYMMEFSLMGVGIFFIGLLANVIGPQMAVGASAVALAITSVLLLVFLPAYRDLD